MTAEQPNLPLKVGRASAKLLAVAPIEADSVFIGKTVHSSGGQSHQRVLTVRSVINPVPAMPVLSQVILDMSRYIEDDQRHRLAKLIH